MVPIVLDQKQTKKLGFRWSNKGDDFLTISDEDQLLVFVNGHRVIQVLDFWGVIYNQQSGSKYYTPNDSKFEILKIEYGHNNLAYIKRND